jgi:uncharacterized membrane protein
MAWIAAYLAALLCLGLLDALWLGWIAREAYQRELGALLRPDILKLPALAFYVGYPAGLLALALHPLPESWATVLLRSMVYGVVAYGTYELTNLATLKGWPPRLALLDLAWGTAATTAAGGLAWWVLIKIR